MSGLKMSRVMRDLAVVLCCCMMLAMAACGHGIEPAMTPAGDEDAAPPDITARGAAVYSLDLDRLVYAKNADEKIDPYSITKILTCYLAIENLSLDDVVTVSSEATRVYENGTTIYLKTGEEISIRNLIYGALLASGNDAAYAIGEAVAGSEESFARLMNETVEGWGCSDTHFVNANGWKDDEHYTTARDMCIIAKNCLDNETLRKMSWKKEYTIPATNMTEERELTNHLRYSAGKVKGITGGKTGSWSEDDCSIVLQYTRRGTRAVLVLLGDTKKGRPADAAALVKFTPEVTPGFIVSECGDIAETARVRHGERTRIELAVDGTTYAYPSSGKARDIRIETSVDKLTAPVKKGDPAGKYRVYANGELIAEHGLAAAEDVQTGWLPSYLYISNKATLVILAVLACIVVIIAVLRHINRKRAVRRRRRRREEAIRRAAEGEKKQ